MTKMSDKKTIFITGSTDGIGKAAALQLIQDGHDVIIHGRSQAKVDALIEECRRNYGVEIKGFVADFSDLQSVAAIAKEICDSVEKIDVLVNNAGVFKVSETKTDTGHDVRFVVNALAPKVFTDEVMSLLEKSDDPRIINLSSAAQAPISLAALRGEEGLEDFAAYAQSKLALTMWSFDLARQYPDMAITALNPGSLLQTNMVMEVFGQARASVDVGAGIIARLATEAEFRSETGKYFDNDRGAFGPAHADAYDEEKVGACLRSLKGEIDKIIG